MGCLLQKRKSPPIFGGRKKPKAEKQKVTILDHMKTLKLVGENGRQPRPNGLVVSAGKCAAPMAAENC
jgi:hypothetical protein